MRHFWNPLDVNYHRYTQNSSSLIPKLQISYRTPHSAILCITQEYLGVSYDNHSTWRIAHILTICDVHAQVSYAMLHSQPYFSGWNNNCCNLSNSVHTHIMSITNMNMQEVDPLFNWLYLLCILNLQGLCCADSGFNFFARWWLYCQSKWCHSIKWYQSITFQPKKAPKM